MTHGHLDSQGISSVQVLASRLAGDTDLMERLLRGLTARAQCLICS